MNRRFHCGASRKTKTIRCRLFPINKNGSTPSNCYEFCHSGISGGCCASLQQLRLSRDRRNNRGQETHNNQILRRHAGTWYLLRYTALQTGGYRYLLFPELSQRTSSPELVPPLSSCGVTTGIIRLHIDGGHLCRHDKKNFSRMKTNPITIALPALFGLFCRYSANKKQKDGALISKK